MYSAPLSSDRYPAGVGQIAETPLTPYFGPPNKPIYIPADADLARQSQTLAQMHEGESAHLTNIFMKMLQKNINGIMSSANGVFPKKKSTDTNFQWKKWEFPTTFLSRAPDGAPPENMTFSVEDREAHSNRYNLGITIRYDFWQTDEGQRTFESQLEAMRLSVNESINQECLRTLLAGKNHYREHYRQYADPAISIEDALEWEKWRTGIFQKEDLGWNLLTAKLTKMLGRRNVTPNLWLVPPGAQQHKALVPKHSTDYNLGGNNIYNNLDKGEDNYKTFDGIRVAEIKDYEYDGDQSINLLRRPREYGGYFVLTEFSPGIGLENYDTKERRTTFVYDLNDDDFRPVDLRTAIKYSQRFDETGQLDPLHENIAENPSEALRETGLSTIGDEKLIDMFIVRDQNRSSKYRVVNNWGEMELSALPHTAVKYFGERFKYSLQEKLDSSALETGMDLIEQLSNFDSSDADARAFIFAVAQQNPTIDYAEDLGTLQKNTVGGVNPPIGIRSGDNILLGVKPTPQADTQFVVRDETTPLGISLTGDAPDEDTLSNYFVGPILPFGYGNWAGMKTLAKIASQGAGSSQRILFDDAILNNAKIFVQQVRKLFGVVRSVFPGNSSTSADNVPFFFRTGKSGEDALTNFAHNIIDGNKQPFFIAKEFVSQPTEEQEQQQDVRVAEFEQAGPVADEEVVDEVAEYLEENFGSRDVMDEKLLPETVTTLTEQLGRFIYQYENGGSKAGSNYGRRPGKEKKFISFLQGEITGEGNIEDIRLLNWLVYNVNRGKPVSMAADNLNSVRNGEQAPRPAQQSQALKAAPQQAIFGTLGDNEDYVVSLLTANASAFSEDDDFIRPANPFNPGTYLEPSEDFDRVLNSAELPITSFFGSTGDGTSGYWTRPSYGKRAYQQDNSRLDSRTTINNNIRDRWVETMNNRDTVERIGQQLLLTSSVTQQQLDAWIDNDMIVPVDVIGARPFRRFEMATAVLIQTPVGYTPMNYENFMVATAVETKITRCHLHLWYGCVLQYEDNFVLAEDIMFTKALGSYDRVPFTPEELNPEDDEYEQSVIYLMVPYGFTRSQTNPLGKTFDITGKFSQQFFSSRMDASAQVDWNRPLYLGAVYYSEKYQLMDFRWRTDPMAADFLSQPNIHNTLVSQEAQRTLDPKTGRYEGIIIETSHLGPNIGQGVKKIFNGLPANFPNFEYAKRQIPNT